MAKLSLINRDQKRRALVKKYAKKREALVDRLVGSDAYIDHWTNKWADLLQVNRKFLASEGAVASCAMTSRSR